MDLLVKLLLPTVYYTRRWRHQHDSACVLTTVHERMKICCFVCRACHIRVPTKVAKTMQPLLIATPHAMTEQGMEQRALITQMASTHSAPQLME